MSRQKLCFVTGLGARPGLSSDKGQYVRRGGPGRAHGRGPLATNELYCDRLPTTFCRDREVSAAIVDGRGVRRQSASGARQSE